MTTDIAKLGFDVDSAAVAKADDDLQDLAQSAQRAGGEVDKFGNKAKGASTKTKTMGKQADAGGRALGAFSRQAGQASIQVQQFVGQVQTGTPFLTAFSQQGADLGIVLGAPLVGVIASLGAALTSTLISALSGSSKALKELTDDLDIFGDELETVSQQVRALAAEQKKSEIEEQQKLVNKINREYEDQAARLVDLRQLYRDRVVLIQDEKTATSELATDLAGVDAERQKEIQTLEKLQEEYDLLTGAKKRESESDAKIAAKKSSDLQEQLNMRRFTGQKELEILRGIDAAEAEAIEKQRQLNASWLSEKRDQRENSSASEIAAIEHFYGRVEELRQQDNMLNAASLQMQLDQRRNSLDAELAALAEFDEQRLSNERANYEFMVDIGRSSLSFASDSADAKLRAEEKALKEAEAAYRKNQTATNEIAVQAAKARAQQAFEEQKKLDGQLILADTAAGVMNALKYGAPGTRWLEAAAVASEGARQYAKNSSLEYSGGGAAPSIPQAPVSGGDTVQNTQTTINIAGNASQDIVDQLKELFGNDNIVIPRGSAQARELRS